MSRDIFSAYNWFFESSDSPKEDKEKVATTLPPFHRRLKHVEVKSIERYLIPGWSGQSLSSKKYFKALSHLETLQKDLLLTLKTENFPPKHLNLIFNEYKSYLQTQPGQNELTLSLAQFAKLLKELGNEGNILNGFAKYYSARLIMLYFLQLRLLNTLQTKLSINEGVKDLLSPPLALNKIFAKGTAKELKAKSLQTNQYSWYRPAEVRLPQVHMLYSLSNDLSFPETLKLLNALQKYNDCEHQTFSHALSHLGIGLLINCLQINLPKWLKNQSAISEIKHQELTVESSLYTGDYLEELAVSHWLAQDNNKTFLWDEILCPHFRNTQISQTGFSCYYHELQLLQLLSEIQVHYNATSLEFIVKIFQAWQENLNSGNQRDLFDEEKFSKSHSYDHTVLSVLQNIRTNPHHHLMQKIYQATEGLKEGKSLIVLSRQNLFLPSQAEKVDSLLRTLMPLCILDFSQLKGKGEAPDYIYVLKKKFGLEKSYSTSQICPTFRFHGQIDTFQNFCFVPEELNSFFQKFLNNSPTIYKSSHGEKSPFEFDFFQNAIVNGVLLHSCDQEGQHITHPQFLKKLLLNAMPLNYYFDIQHIDGKSLIIDKPSWSVDQKLPISTQINTDLNDYGEYSLILDMRDQLRPKLEFIARSLLKIKVYDYGISECYYYNLTPKFKKLNIRFFNEFTKSNIGKQISAISLLGNKNQIRSKISSLLIPNLFIKNPSLTASSSSNLNYYKIQETLTQLKEISNFDDQSIVDYIEKISIFQELIQKLIDKSNAEKDNLKEFNFNTPDMKNALLKMKLHPIYPNNKELNVELLVHDINNSNNIIDKHELSIEPLVSRICLFSSNNTIAKITGNTVLIIFIHFLLKKIPPMKILDILTQIRIPSALDCTSLVKLKDLELERLKQLDIECSRVMENLFHQGIVR